MGFNPIKAVKNGANAVGHVASSGANAVGHTVSNGAHAAGDVVTDVGKAAGHVVTDVGKAAGHAVADVGNAAGHAVTDVGKAAGHVVTDVGKAAGDAVADVGNAAGYVVTDLGKAVGEAEAGKAVGNAIADAGKAAGHAVADVGKAAGDQVTDAWETAGDAVADAGKVAGDVITDAGKTAGDVITDLGSGDLRKAAVDAGVGIGKAASDLATDLGKTGTDLGIDLAKAVADDGIGIGKTSLDLALPALEYLNQVFSLYTRSLTADEIRIAQSVFGDSIDYGDVRVTVGNVLELVNGRPRTTGDTINTAHGFDMSHLDDVNGVNGAATLIHELTHVWQYNHFGADYIARSIGDQVSTADIDGKFPFIHFDDDAYKFNGHDLTDADLVTHMNKGEGLLSFGVEQQAKIMEDYFIEREEATTSTLPSKQMEVNHLAHFAADASTLDEMHLADVHPGTPFWEI